MPVRYDIAAGVPQAQGGGFDPMNAFATMQAMSYRQQQNALAEMQMQKMLREAQVQNALSGVLTNPNFNVQSPDAVAALVHSGNLPEGLSVLGAQRQAAALQGQEAAHQSTAAYQTGMLDIARAKLPLEVEKLESEAKTQKRLMAKAVSEAETADLLRIKERTGMAQGILSRMIGDPNNYQANLDELYKFDPKLATHLPQEAYDEKAIKRNLNTAESVRTHIEKEEERRAKQEEISTIFPTWAPGYGLQTTPGGMMRLIAPQQPGMNMPTNMMAPAMPGQNAFTNAPPLAAPTAAPAEAPAPPMGTPEYAGRQSARAMLDIAGFDQDKGGDHVSDLIKKTPTSAFRAYAQQKEGGFKGKATPEMENVGRLNTIMENLKLAYAGGKLGSGVTDADMRILDRAQAQINDPSVQPNQRMAAWDEWMRIYSKKAGYKYTPMTEEQVRGEPIIGQRKPAAIDETSVLTDIFGAKK